MLTAIFIIIFIMKFIQGTSNLKAIIQGCHAEVSLHTRDTANTNTDPVPLMGVDCFAWILDSFPHTAVFTKTPKCLIPRAKP